MIAVRIEGGYAEGLDGRDTEGWVILIQLFALNFSFWVTWGRK